MWALHLHVCHSAILHQPVIPVEEPVPCTTQADLNTGTLILHISLFQLKPQTDLFWLKAIIHCSLSGESILLLHHPIMAAALLVQNRQLNFALYYKLIHHYLH